MILGQNDKDLLMLLRENARMSISDLARALNISRSTAKDRLERLESRGVIKRYSLVLSEEYSKGQVVAHVMMNIDTKKSNIIVRNLRKIDEIDTSYAVSGIYDLICVISTSSTEQLNQVLDQMMEIDGVHKTLTTIILSTKFDR